MPRQAAIDRLARDLPGKRGLILCGPQDDPALAAAVVSLAAKLGYPVLADPLSGVRFGPHARDLVLDCYDAFLRDGAFAARFAPEVVLRFGAMPTAKPVLLYLERHPGARLIVVDDDGWNEPASLASDVIQAGAVLFCQALAHALPVSGAAHSGWLADWIGADRRARAALQAALAGDQELSEGKVFAELADLLPDGTALYVGNSMPVRDLDTFFQTTERRIRCLANRGANGIDGVVSSALGASTPPDGPTVLVIGDVSFYHDLNGLLAAQQHGLNLTIILLNNDGGGIFSFLPQAAEPEHFEQLFGTPHGLDFRPFAEGYGAAFMRVEGWEDFRSAVMASLAAGGVQVIEVPTNRARNVAQHRALWPLVNAAVAAGLAPEVTA